jgi:hypothetical protein
MTAKGVSGVALAAMATGGVLLWSGINNRSVTDTLTSLLKGAQPTAGAGQQLVSATSSTATTAPAGSASYDSSNALQTLWTSNGGDPRTAAFAAKVAMAESSGNAGVTSANPDGGTNVGIWQLDTKGVGAGYSVAQLQNANTNARITIMATHNGTVWSQWGDPVTAAVGYHYTPGSPV